jgi:hypothetical protein
MLKTLFFWVVLEHNALPEFSWLKLREHNFVSINFRFLFGKDLETFLLTKYINTC